MSSLPPDIAWIKRHPGTYAVTSDPRHCYFAVVEVDQQGRIYQLNSVGQRDGILSDDGWTQDREVHAHYYDPDSEDCIKERVTE